MRVFYVNNKDGFAKSPTDDRVISGESGAVTLGLLTTVLTQSSCRKIANALQLNESSTVLLISTEGDTDPSMYRKIVWG